jgi:hypothetical protein
MRRAVNLKFVVRSLALSLLLAVVILLGWLRLIGFGPTELLPPAPTIAAPRGEWPAHGRGFEEWASYSGEPDALVGSGFLLELDDGRAVGVTTAHSVELRNPARPLENVQFRAHGEAGFITDFSQLHGLPGVPRAGDDMTVDYVLLRPRSPVDAQWLLRPDTRGTAQPGERVTLFSGLGGRDGRLLDGTVQTVDAQAIWVTMDGWFNPALLSGSPFVSRHTGRVVGMLIAGSLRGNRICLAAHPIGSLVQRALSAASFPALAAVSP